MKIFAAQINPTIGDIEGNARKVFEALDRARDVQADIVLFPEMTLSGYPPEDLLLDLGFIEALSQQLTEIAYATKGLFAVIGVPRRNLSGIEKPLYNSAAVFRDGVLLGFHNKQLLPTYDVFDEMRFFQPGDSVSTFEYLGRRIAITICEDLWQHSGTVGYTHYTLDPVKELQKIEVDLVLNLSASPYYFKRKDTRFQVFGKVAKSLQAPLVLCNQVGANDQLVFDGYSMALNEKGELFRLAKGFVEDDLIVDLDVLACPCTKPEDGIRDLYSALVLGVRDYLGKQGIQKAMLGLSGGIDSAVVACIAKEALGGENLFMLTLPSRFTAATSVADAELLAHRLGVPIHKISIEPLFQGALDVVEPHFEGKPWDATEENLQSRARCQILMAFSNKFGALLLNASNKSEMALGYTTLYGDLCGGLGVLQDVTKQAIYQLARYINREKEIIPASILHKAPSAELREDQKDTDTLPPFEILDAVIEDYVEERLDPEKIAQKRGIALGVVQEIAAKIHAFEYKRRQAPIGIRVTQKAFSKGRNVPIVQKWRH